MPQTAIFGPFFALMGLTLLVWLYMYVRRISFIRAERLGQHQLENPVDLTRLSPAYVANPSDNFKNLFELPVIFYALMLYLYATHEVDAIYVSAAWVFVAVRAVHSLVHCTFNLIMPRFYIYLISSLALWYIAARAAAAWLSS